MAKPRRQNRHDDELVMLSVRVHAEARRQLKSVVALEDMTMEEKVREIVYRELGLNHLPVHLETSAVA